MELRDGLQIRERAITLQKALGDAVRGCTQKYGDKAWYQNTLLGLASEAQLSLVEVLEGDNNRQITRVAWGARNLLELHYWTRFLLCSPENARRFFEDMICDYQELLNRMRNIQGWEPIVKLAQAEIDKLAPKYQRISASTKHLSVADVARQFGEEKQFGLANQFLSKFVHPTSLSVQSRLSPELYTLLAPGFVNVGATYADGTFPLLTDALRKGHVSLCRRVDVELK